MVDLKKQLKNTFFSLYQKNSTWKMCCFHNIGKYFGDRSDVSMLIIGCCHRPGGRWVGSREGSVTPVDSDSAIVYSIV